MLVGAETDCSSFFSALAAAGGAEGPAEGRVGEVPAGGTVVGDVTEGGDAVACAACAATADVGGRTGETAPTPPVLPGGIAIGAATGGVVWASAACPAERMAPPAGSTGAPAGGVVGLKLAGGTGLGSGRFAIAFMVMIWVEYPNHQYNHKQIRL